MLPCGKLQRKFWQAVFTHSFQDGHSLERAHCPTFFLGLLILAIVFLSIYLGVCVEEYLTLRNVSTLVIAIRNL